MRIYLRLYFALCFFALNLKPGSAHHSTAIYDLQEEISISGVVTEVRWRNPHVYIYVKDSDNLSDSSIWEIEGLPPSGFMRAGWNQDTLIVGEQLTVRGNPTRNRERQGIYPQSIIVNGTEIFNLSVFDTQTLKATDAGGIETNGIDGIWATELNTDLLIKLGEGAIFENLTPKGEAAVASFDEQTMSPMVNCEQVVPPFSMFIPDTKKILIEENVIKIFGSFDGGERIVHMSLGVNGGAISSPHGQSIGRWEENTLVVNTTNFSENRIGNGWGLPSSAEKRMEERFSLNSDKTSLTYEFLLTDPVYMTSTVIGIAKWKYAPNLGFSTEVVECDQDSASRFIDD